MDLPKKLVVVEFRSLTVTEGPKVKPQRMPDASCKKNFKGFRKVSPQCGMDNKNMPRNVFSFLSLLWEHLGNYRTFICTLLNSVWISASRHGHVWLLFVHGCVLMLLLAAVAA